jgi:uncharacterized membrane protein YphA (DoxX/SURF4 family)
MSTNARVRSRPAADIGLLLLRIIAGISLLLLFGIPKIEAAVHFRHTAEQWPFVAFNRRVRLPRPVMVAYLQTLNESLGALLVAIGLLCRTAGGTLAIAFAVATFCSVRVHESSWVLAAAYGLVFAALVFTGPGEFSIDNCIANRMTTRRERVR